MDLRKDAAAVVPESVLSTGTETVLCVDDEETVLDLVSAQLRFLGYRVLTAGNSEEAIALAHAHAGEIQLLLSDFMMPDMGGGELAPKLAKILPGLRVIFISGYFGTGTHVPDLPHARFLDKPFQIEQLSMLVRSELDGHSR